ncbi:MAG TPA: cysteine desulfurase family protein, partial [Candidatus Acidoferrales bacterium]|nr:cysteine desulfurase family protein [Candidatus Acidoferrales bacterium]
MTRIYLDNAATTPLRQEVVDAMDAARADAFNPSSLHEEGRRARARLDDARDRVAACLGVSRKEIAFTGSGTESDNAAILGAVRASGRKGHVLASAIDHHAVIHALDALAAEGHEVELLPVDERGAVDPAAFAAALRPATILASVFYANNEIGTVSPVAELARIARERGVLFHTDAVQAPGWLPVDAASLGADLLSISAHKFEGPKGVGALYVRSGVVLEPIVHGGGQEFGRRSGTENVLGAVGMARALELAVGDAAERTQRVARLRDRLESGIAATIGGVRFNGAGGPRLPGNSNVSFADALSEELLLQLDLQGVAVSAGSACASGAIEPSHVIEALHIDPRWRSGPIRFSLGRTTTEEEIDRVLALLP